MARPAWKIEYVFFGEADTPWRSVFEFERDLSEFFSTKGQKAETFPQMEGDNSRRFVWLSKKEELLSQIPDSNIKNSDKKSTNVKPDISGALDKAKKAFGNKK